MSYRIAGIDVHKKMLAVAVADVAVAGDFPFERQKVGTTPTELGRLAVQLQNRLEALLEEAHIKVSSLVSDLLGISARRMLQALADGETDPAALAMLATARLRATPEQLCDAFQARPTRHPVYRRLLKLTLEELRVIEDHLGQLDQQMADLLTAHHDAVQRLAEVPGLGVDSAQQIIAEVGASAAAFPSAKQLASWMGACPGNEESAGVNHSHRCPKGNRQMRRVLNQAANAAVKAKGTLGNMGRVTAEDQLEVDPAFSPVLNVSRRTVLRDWALARTWLFRELGRK